MVSKTGTKQSLATGVARRDALVRAVNEHFQKHDRAPSLSELATAVGVSSKNAVRLHVAQLIEQGLLSKDAKGRLNPGPAAVEVSA